MNPTDPLANLRDIHLPEAISWWPLAPGWWFLIALVSAILIYGLMHLIKRYQKRLYRRQAIRHLREIENLQGQHQLVELFALLKRTAISAYPDLSLANLSPKAFIEFLKTTCKKPIFQHMPDNLDTMLYAEQAQITPTAKDLCSSARLWIKRHPKNVHCESLPPC